MTFKDHIRLPDVKKPWVYTNFVQTIDGKTAVTGARGNEYWPLGSTLDYELLTGLRERADVLVHGARTAQFCRTLDRIGSVKFQNRRKRLGITRPLLYCVVSRQPSKALLHLLADPPSGTDVYIASQSSLKKMIEYLSARYAAHRILLEGGPTLMGSFLKENLVNELFLTITPKIIGSRSGHTRTLAEGVLFEPSSLIHASVVSCLSIDNEVFLRYSL